jgi:FkbM family methyltransferase
MIHVTGDSHVMVFSGKEHIPAEVDDRGFLPFFRTYRLGPYTAYQVEKRRPLIESMVKQNVGPDDSVMLCFGEIDCRAHLVKQSEHQGRPLEDIVAECVSRYARIFDIKEKYGIRLLVWNVPASSREDIEQGEYSTYGTCVQRNEAASLFNKILSEECKNRGIPFVSIFDELVDEDGLTRTEYYADAIHLSQRAMPLILDACRKQLLMDVPLKPMGHGQDNDLPHRAAGLRQSTEGKRVLIWCGIREIAKLVALRPNYDLCYVIEAEESRLRSAKRIFGKDAGVKMFRMASVNLLDFCKQQCITRIETLSIDTGANDLDLIKTIERFAKKKKVNRIECDLQPEQLRALVKLCGDGYDVEPASHGDETNGSLHVQCLLKGETEGAIRLNNRGPCVFNVVYAHLRDEEAHSIHREHVSLIWSRLPVEGCDLYLYVNAYSFTGRQNGLNVLLLHEPAVVLPGQYDESIWNYFDRVITFYDGIVDGRENFTKVLMPRSGIQRFIVDSDITENRPNRESKYPLAGRNHGICMINGNKGSRVTGELYSKRVEAALWFHEHSAIPFDVFGNPPFSLPNYKGALPADAKLSTLAQYRYNLCFENIHHPVLSSGFVDKILSCLETRTIPIYLGAPNIDTYIPRECFIDFRSFKDYGELERFLTRISEKQYAAYIESIDDFVVKGGLRPYSWNTLYDQLIQIYAASQGTAIGSLCSRDNVWEWGLTPDVSNRTFQETAGEPLWSFDQLARHAGEVVVVGAAHSGDAEETVGRPVDGLLKGPRKDLPAGISAEFERLYGLIESDRAGVDDYYHYAQILITKERFDDAMPVLNKVTALFPSHTYALNDIAVIHFQRREFDAALAAWRRALEANPGNINALGNSLRTLKSLNRGEDMAALGEDILTRLHGSEEARTRALAVLGEFNLPKARPERGNRQDAQPMADRRGHQEVRGGRSLTDSGYYDKLPTGNGSDSYYVHKTAQLERRELITIGKNAEIKDYVIIRTYKSRVTIGEYSELNPFTMVCSNSTIHIGDNVMIAPHCMIASGSQDFGQTDLPMRFPGNLTGRPIVIEDDVWIGPHCTIADGVRIGRNAVVAANSLVSEDVEPYAVVGGVPAKVIGHKAQEGEASRALSRSSSEDACGRVSEDERDPLARVKISIDSPGFDSAGYDEDDAKKNGELNLISGLIQSGDVVFDVGANRGFWSREVLSLHREVRLFAFEPVPKTFETLKRNVRSGSPPVGTFNVALSHEDAEKAFYHYANNEKISELSTFHRRVSVEKQLGLQPRPITVKATRLDTFCEKHSVSHIDYLKIDTEGGELDVLKGAEGLLRGRKVTFIQFEYGGTYADAKVTLKQVCEFLTSFGYALFRVVPDGLLHIGKWRNELENYRLSNYLAAALGQESVWKAMEVTAKRPAGIAVFSKDRAMQLDCTLRTLHLHCSDIDQASIRVIYTTSSYFHERGYEKLKREFPSVDFVREKAFKNDLMSFVSSLEHVLFLVDDNIFVSDFRLGDMLGALTGNRSAIGYSLRLGRNTTSSYMLGRSQSLPDFASAGNGCLSFDWTASELDFGYPLEVSSSLYRVSDILPLLNGLDYRNPNTLEAFLDGNKAVFRTTHPRLLCYETSVTFCNPANKVQNICANNRAGADDRYAPDRLQNMFLKGYSLDGEKFADFVANACHQEVEVGFKRRVGTDPTFDGLSDRPAVSIAIPNYNGLNHIKICLESIRRNTPEDHELIVIDNGSTDGSLKYLRAVPGIILIENPENVGAPGARNQALSIARGDYVVFMDNDTIVTKDWLSRFIDHAEKNPNVGIIGACTNYATGPQRVADADSLSYRTVEELEAYAAKRADEHRDELIRSPRLISFCIFFGKEVVERIGGMDTSFSKFCYEDDDYSIRATIAGLSSVVALDVFIHHTGGPQGRGDKEYNAWLAQAWEGFRKKWKIDDSGQPGLYVPEKLAARPYVRSEHCVPLPERQAVKSLIHNAGNGTGGATHAETMRPADTAQEHYQKALSHEQGGRIDLAMEELEQVVAIDEKHAEALNDLGVLYYRKGDRQKALQMLSESVMAEPSNVGHLKNLAALALELGETQDAIGLYGKILALSPGDVESLLVVGRLCEQSGQMENALRFVRTVLEKEPGNAQALEMVARISGTDGNGAEERHDRGGRGDDAASVAAGDRP